MCHLCDFKTVITAVFYLSIYLFIICLFVSSLYVLRLSEPQNAHLLKVFQFVKQSKNNSYLVFKAPRKNVWSLLILVPPRGQSSTFCLHCSMINREILACEKCPRGTFDGMQFISTTSTYPLPPVTKVKNDSKVVISLYADGLI